MKLSADVCALLGRELVGAVGVVVTAVGVGVGVTAVGVGVTAVGVTAVGVTAVGVVVVVAVERLVTGGLTGTGALLAPVRFADRPPIGCKGMELRRIGRGTLPKCLPSDPAPSIVPTVRYIAATAVKVFEPNSSSMK